VAGVSLRRREMRARASWPWQAVPGTSCRTEAIGMAPGLQIVLSGALTFGVPLLFAVRELRALRRPWRGPDDRDRAPDPVPPPDPPGDQPALKPLPACLIPTPRPTPTTARPRVREPA
jgi:hypothetical protein